jgi:hypothetical protein
MEVVMPNHVKNRLTITGDDAENIMSSLCTVSDDGYEMRVDFNKVIPRPDGMDIDSDGWVALLENKFSTESFKTFIDRFVGFGHHKDSDRLDATLANFTQGIKNYVNYGHASWYGWNVKNWGTKWGAYEFGDKRDTATIAHFETAWSAPLPVIKRLSEKFPNNKFQIQWSDEDTSCNCGDATYVNGCAVFGGEVENGSVEAWSLFFDLRPEYKDQYKLVDGEYVYAEE